MQRFLAALAAFVPLASMMHADPVFTSGPSQVALIELYTSEGCSSCPPAEKWLGELRREKGLWRDFVPVAFHVNYWDHLGWRDALASKVYTQRQHAHAARWQASSVYTPCFVRNGAEWRPRDGGPPESRARAEDGGKLTVAWQADGNRCQISYVPSVPTRQAGDAPAGFDVTVALLGGDIVRKVGKGENAGRELRHDFVVLRLENAALDRATDGTWRGMLTLPPRTDIVAPKRALAAWVTPSRQLAPLQATGGWLE